MERQYLKTIMESLQYLGRQGIPLRGKEEGNDNFTQLLLLRGKDHPFLIERLTSTREHGSLYVHHNYQNDLLCQSSFSEKSYMIKIEAGCSL